MTQVNNSRTLNASGDAVWRVVADPARLADWVPTTCLVRAVDPEDVHLEGESHGHPHAVTSPFHADQAQRRLDLRAPGVPGCKPARPTFSCTTDSAGWHTAARSTNPRLATASR
jgi:hypothetical protein